MVCKIRMKALDTGSQKSSPMMMPFNARNPENIAMRLPMPHAYFC
jgi:hypothetical protein